MSEPRRPEAPPHDPEHRETPPAIQVIAPAQLEEWLAAHRAWIESRGAEGKRASFYRAMLQDAYLHGSHSVVAATGARREQIPSAAKARQRE